MSNLPSTLGKSAGKNDTTQLARELIKLLGDEDEFRHPVELDVPPGNWPKNYAFELMNAYIAENPDYARERISAKRHEDSFAQEVELSNQRLARIGELESMATVKERAHQILDRTLRSFEDQDTDTNLLSQDDLRGKAHRVLLEHAKHQKPDLFREQNKSFAVDIVIEIGISGEVKRKFRVDIDMDTEWLQVLLVFKTFFTSENKLMQCPPGQWHYTLLKNDELRILNSEQNLNLFKTQALESEAVPLIWHVSCHLRQSHM
jgi:hypothetical protein